MRMVNGGGIWAIRVFGFYIISLVGIPFVGGNILFLSIKIFGRCWTDFVIISCCSFFTGFLSVLASSETDKIKNEKPIAVFLASLNTAMCLIMLLFMLYYKTCPSIELVLVIVFMLIGGWLSCFLCFTENN